MPPATTAPSSLGSPIPIGNIDAELRNLWLADESSARASLVNFAIYSESENSLQDNTELIEEITAEQACRAILIQADPACKESSAQAWITAHCRIDPGGKKNICSEQIAFSLCGPTSDLLRNIVFAHLDSDLPLVLWWQGDLTENFEERLYSRIDRLIVNADRWSDPQASFAALQRALADTGNRIAIHDISWSRSYHFRLAVASLFDDPSASSRLADINTVAITHSPHCKIAARMVSAWFARQLRLETDANNATGTRRDGSSIQFEHIGSGDEGSMLCQIEIVTSDARFAITREAGSRFLRTKIEAPEKSHEALSPAGPKHRAQLVAELMARAGSNSLYRAILASTAWLCTSS